MLAMLTLGMAAGANAPQIWMFALEPQWRKVMGYSANDWGNLFDSTAAWPIVASHLQVFEISKRFVVEADEAQLRRVLAFLRIHHIKLALQGTPLTATRTCGLGVEGHGPAHDMQAEASRIRRAGGELSYIAMDEPLFYGRFLKFFAWKGKRKTCDYSISELAAQAAQKISEVRSVFPSVIVGDTEPFGISADYSASWKESLVQWIDEYKSAAGSPLAFLQADVVWRAPTWRADLLAGAEIAMKKSIPFGLIYNASPNDTDWTTVAADHFRTVEHQLGIRPAQ